MTYYTKSEVEAIAGNRKGYFKEHWSNGPVYLYAQIPSSGAEKGLKMSSGATCLGWTFEEHSIPKTDHSLGGADQDRTATQPFSCDCQKRTCRHCVPTFL